MSPESETRKIVAKWLDLRSADFSRDPDAFAAWIEENRLTRALVHLVARCADRSVPLQATPLGRLMGTDVAPGIDPDINSYVYPVAGASGEVDLLTAQPRIVEVSSNVSGLLVSDGDATGVPLVYRGISAAAGVLRFVTPRRYIQYTNIHSSSVCRSVFSAWNL